MSCDAVTGLLSDRLKGVLSAEDQRRLDAHLAACPACREEADAVAALWTEMEPSDDEAPRERMRARFYAALSAYEARAAAGRLEALLERVWPRGPAAQAGIAVLLLVVGLAAGLYAPSSTNDEIAALREEIRTMGLVLLEHPSASERLRGVAWARQVAPDPRAVEALLAAIRHDPSLNVRLAALEALSERVDRPSVGAALADALERQDAPLMQVTLARVLLDGGVDGSAEVVRRMLEREELDAGVREYLSTVLSDGNDDADNEIL